MRKLTIEELNRLSLADFKAADKRPVVVVLDNVRSMHNVGAVLRTADAFCIEKVYLCGITPRPPHREIRKTAIGAEESVDWEYHADILPLAQSLKADGYQLLPLEQAAGSTQLDAFETQTGDQYALIIGHEIEGVQQAVIDLSDTCLEIPQFGTKHSLNVSVAAGIAMHHLTKG